VLNSLNPHDVIVNIQKVEDPEAELDEMWSSRVRQFALQYRHCF